MTQYPDIMVDIETTGTDPSRTAMIQLAAVKFNVEEGTVDSNFFDMSLAIPWGRSWSEDTRKWWLKDKAHILNEILAKGQPAAQVMSAFQQWAVKNPGPQPLRFWSKPMSFDWPFVASYFEQFGVFTPFDFREAVDMRTWMRAKLGSFDSAKIYEVEKSVPFSGPAHNALYDTLHQVKVVLKVAEMTKAKVAA